MSINYFEAAKTLAENWDAIKARSTPEQIALYEDVMANPRVHQAATRAVNDWTMDARLGRYGERVLGALDEVLATAGVAERLPDELVNRIAMLRAVVRKGM